MKLKIERVKRGLTQGQLSECSNVGLNTIVKLERGKIDSVSVKVLIKIASALDMSVQELFFDEEEQPKGV